MGATEEQMALVAASGMDHVSYILILFSFAFVIFLFVSMLIRLYDGTVGPAPDYKDLSNGRPHANGREADQSRLREAEEFELDGLVSDDEDEERGLLRSGGNVDAGLESPSTLGKNNESRAR